MAVGDEAGGEAEEGFVDVITSLPADAETSEAVEPGDRALDNPAVNSEARTVQNTASGDDRFDAPSPDQAAVLAVDRAGAAFGPRRAARTWEESITARDQSSCFAARSLASSTTWSRSQTPASFQAASRLPARHARTEAQLLRQVLPLDPGMQHEQGAAQGLAVRNSRPAGHQLRRRNRQQRLDQQPQFIRDDPRTFPTYSPTSIQADSHII